MSSNYKSYRVSLNKQMDKKMKRALTAIGIFLVSKMKLLVPVDTGRLKSSLAYDVEGDTVRYGASTESSKSNRSVYYALFIELGTRFMAAQPFVRPALFNNKKKISELAQKAYSEGVQ